MDFLKLSLSLCFSSLRDCVLFKFALLKIQKFSKGNLSIKKIENLLKYRFPSPITQMAVFPWAWKQGICILNKFFRIVELDQIFRITDLKMPQKFVSTMIPSGTIAFSTSNGGCMYVRILEYWHHLEFEGLRQPSKMKYCSLPQVVMGCLYA